MNSHPWRSPRPVIRVRLACVDDWINESKVKILNVEEDIQGRDILTFTCPKCGEEHKSLRVG